MWKCRTIWKRKCCLPAFKLAASMLHTRRNFLQLGSVSAATLALSPVLNNCASPGDYEAAANEVRRPIAKNGDNLRELVRLATLAPSGHNTQPWKFKIAADNIRIYPESLLPVQFLPLKLLQKRRQGI